MAEKIGEFSMEHVVSSYSRNANGDIVSTTDWRGSGSSTTLGRGQVFGSFISAAPLSESNVKSGEIEFIGQDFWLDKNSLNKVISDVKSHFNLKEELSVNKFKSITGLSRKTAIPLLEYFDSKKLTLRSNNMRLKGEKLI